MEIKIDLGNNPDYIHGKPPTPAEKHQIKYSLELENVENTALSNWGGNNVLTINSSQVTNFTSTVNNILSANVIISNKGNSDQWSSTYTTVQANSAAWAIIDNGDDINVSTKVRSSSANWDSTYTTVRASSANWDNAYNNTLILSTNKANLSGGNTFSGNQTIIGSISASQYLGIPSGDDVLASTKVRASSANWDSTYTTVQANSAAWEAYGLQSAYVWAYDTNATMADPGNGKVRSNTSTAPTDTQLAFSIKDKSGTDTTFSLNAISVGDTVFAQERSDANNWAKWLVNGTVNNTTWFLLSVTHIESSGASVGKNKDVLVKFLYNGNTAILATKANLSGGNIFSGDQTIIGSISASQYLGIPSNTTMVGITGTTSQFNNALSDNDFCTLSGTETMYNKTLSAPVIFYPTIIPKNTTGDGSIYYTRLGEYDGYQTLVELPVGNPTDLLAVKPNGIQLEWINRYRFVDTDSSQHNIGGEKTFLNNIYNEALTTLSAVNITSSLTVTASTFNYSNQAAVAHREALKIINLTPYAYSQLVINNQIDETTIYIVTE